MSLDQQNQIGKISKEYAGFIREAFTTADRFGVSCKFKYPQTFIYILIKTRVRFFQVPTDLSVKVKATLIGALFLIVN